MPEYFPTASIFELLRHAYTVEKVIPDGGVVVGETRRAGLAGEIRGQQGEGRAGPQVCAALLVFIGVPFVTAWDEPAASQ